jgi:hypothetical protein
MTIRRSLLAALAAVSLFQSAPAAEPSAPQPRMGINLAGPEYWTTETPFANLAKFGGRWRSQAEGAPFTWDDPLPPMTADGYPTKVEPDRFIESFLIGNPKRTHLGNEFVLLYEGKGKLRYVQAATLKESVPGRDVITDEGAERGSVTVQITETDPADPIRNIRLYEPRFESNPPTFRPEFLKRWGNMSAIRFMDLMKTNNSKIRTWDDRPRAGTYTYTEKGVPLDDLIALANTQKAAPWFCMPHLADDDYVRKFAEQVKRDLDPSLPVYVEYSNEVWNSIFEQSRYAAARGKELKLSENAYEAQLKYHGRRTSEVLAIWDEVFADTAPRVLGVYATQAVNPWTSETVLGDAGAKKYADVLAIAPYFGNDFGLPERQAETVAYTPEQLFAALKAEVDGPNKKAIDDQAALAKRLGVKLVAYEGGQHLAGVAEAANNTTLEAMCLAANSDPRMGELYKTHFDNWVAAGGDLYVVFSSVSTWSKWGSWGLLQNESDDPAASPKFQAVQRFIAEHPPRRENP